MSFVALDSITQDDLRSVAEKARGREDQLEPMEAAALAFAEHGLEEAAATAQRAAEKFKTPGHDAVLAVLDAVYENDPPQPNDCGECGRSFGPNYTGPCEH